MRREPILRSLAIRGIDLVVAILALAIAAIPMLVIALAIRLGDGGPALFKQARVGRGGHIFPIFKFRTMRVDRSGAGAGVPRAGETTAEAASRFQRTEPGDARITRIGRFLRPSHLDELPQLINVLLGHMSLVGVRPDTPAQQGDYVPQYWTRRHRFRPGITGPAQLRSDRLDMSERTREELTWLNGQSLELYVSILARTLAKVARRSSF